MKSTASRDNTDVKQIYGDSVQTLLLPRLLFILCQQHIIGL